MQVVAPLLKPLTLQLEDYDTIRRKVYGRCISLGAFLLCYLVP
jgi:hypothetical protein